MESLGSRLALSQHYIVLLPRTRVTLFSHTSRNVFLPRCFSVFCALHLSVSDCSWEVEAQSSVLFKLSSGELFTSTWIGTSFFVQLGGSKSVLFISLGPLYVYGKVYLRLLFNWIVLLCKPEMTFSPEKTLRVIFSLLCLAVIQLLSFVSLLFFCTVILNTLH